MIHFTSQNIFWQTNQFGQALGTILLANKFAVNFKQVDMDAAIKPIAEALFSLQILSPVINRQPMSLTASPTGTLMPTLPFGLETEGDVFSLDQLADLLNRLQKLEPTEDAQEISYETIIYENTDDRNEWLDLTQFGEDIINPETSEIIPPETLDFQAPETPGM